MVYKALSTTGGGGGGVISLNGETGALNLTSSSTTIQITTSGLNNIDLEVESINGLLTQGTNVTLTGSGTPASPYNISASGGGSISQATFSFVS